MYIDILMHLLTHNNTYIQGNSRSNNILIDDLFNLCILEEFVPRTLHTQVSTIHRALHIHKMATHIFFLWQRIIQHHIHVLLRIVWINDVLDVHKTHQLSYQQQV